MRNLLKNIFTKFEAGTKHMLTVDEKNVADTFINFIQHELYEMENLIIEEKNIQEEDAANPPAVPRKYYNTDKMTRITNLMKSIIISMNRLSSETTRIQNERSQSTLAHMMLTPEQFCHVRGSRKLDPSSLTPVHPHEVQHYMGDYPIAFKSCSKRVNSIIEQENIFAIFAPVNLELGKSIQALFVITS